MKVSLHNPHTGARVLTADATFQGCISPLKKGAKWCNLTAATMIIEQHDAGGMADQVIADFVGAKISNFTMQISAIDAVKPAGGSMTASRPIRSGASWPIRPGRIGAPTVLATVAKVAICIKNDEFCIKNDECFIKNDEFCINMMNCAGLPAARPRGPRLQR